MPARGSGKAHFAVHVEAPPPALAPRFVVIEEVLEHDRPHPGPAPAGRSEIGNASFRREAGSREGDDLVLGDRRDEESESQLDRGQQERAEVTAALHRQPRTFE